MKLDAHLFICTNTKKDGSGCASLGSQELRDKVKEACSARPEWKGRLRINNAGCLGRCEHGIAAVLYPEGKWLLQLKKNDTEKLLEAIENALKE